MEVCPDIASLHSALAPLPRPLGCVMTMGALHAGHVRLLETARNECDSVVATIFVNPTQFAAGEDLDKYPRPLEDDLAKCEAAGVDVVFTPTNEALYPDGFQTFVTAEEVSRTLEGAHRPTHFRGVCTVVLKLLNLLRPDTAYFGQKDFQQQLVIRQMVRDLNVPTAVRTVETVREPDGLAMSSRNAYLSAEERGRALSLSRALKAAADSAARSESVPVAEQAMRAELGDVDVDYAVIVDPESLGEPRPGCDAVALVAAKVGSTRLIDNRMIRYAKASGGR